MTEQPIIDRITLTNPAQGTPTSRTITGCAAPFGKIAARTSAGMPIMFQPGCFRYPEDLSRVKLCIEHARPTVVGYLTETETRDDGEYATFTIPESTAGNEALTAAANHLRDGLSVGIDVIGGAYTPDGETYVITEAIVEEISLCTFPAFTDARTTTVTMTQPERTTMQPATTASQALTQPPSGHPATDNKPQPTTASQAPTQPPSGPRQAPPFLAAAPASLSLSDTYARIAGLASQGMTAGQITAALQDVVPDADKGHGLLRPDQIGELWQARTEGRPYVDAATNRKLKSGLETTAWAWTTLPEVGEYAGNKAEIPSNKPGTTMFKATNKRMAGGWDIDRIYVDLGDADIIGDMFTGAIADYNRKTNAALRTEILAAATAVTGAKNLTDTLTAFGIKAVEVGARIDFIAVATDVWAAFANLTKDQVPWWLGGGDNLGLADGNGQAGKLGFIADPALPKGTVVAFDKRAVNWFERTPPVRAQALDIAHGGVDLGVFGYYATLISEPKAVWKTTITDAPGV